jgi:hypothetical protein
MKMNGKVNKTLDYLSKDRFRKFLKFPKSILFILTVIFQNCQAPTEGCLDVRATNFDVTASKACEKACQCTYPALVISANYKMDTSNFYFDSTYMSGGQKFRVVSAQMYLSDFQLINSQNSVFRTLDSVALSRATDTINVLKNYALVGKSVGFDFAIGSFTGTGGFTKFKFRVGLDDVTAKAVPTKMPLTDPLSIKSDSMYISSSKQYIFNKFVIAKGVNFKDTLRLNILAPQDLQIVKNLSFTEGVNAKIPLTINYSKFFTGVDFSLAPKLIEDKISLNTPTVFSLEK